jgi:hypothetical protein
MPDQPDKPTHRRWQIPWAAMLLVAMLGVYVGGYLALSIYEPPPFGLHTPAQRVVDYEWMMTLYEPLRITESAIRGTEVRFAPSWRIIESWMILPR